MAKGFANAGITLAVGTLVTGAIAVAAPVAVAVGVGLAVSAALSLVMIGYMTIEREEGEIQCTLIKL